MIPLIKMTEAGKMRAWVIGVFLLAACESDQQKLERLRLEIRQEQNALNSWVNIADGVQNAWLARYVAWRSGPNPLRSDSVDANGYVGDRQWREAMDSASAIRDRLIFLERDLDRLLR